MITVRMNPNAENDVNSETSELKYSISREGQLWHEASNSVWLERSINDIKKRKNR